MIAMLDVRRQYSALQQELESAALEVLRSGQYIGGQTVQDFEARSAAALGVKHAIGVANGTDALQLCLQVAGVGPGDEVITTPFTFVATAEVISSLGARPVFVDIEPDTFCLDPRAVEAAVTERTRAIIPVHLFGHPADMVRLNAVARRHGIHVIEDAAQAWGASLETSEEAGAAPNSCGGLGTMAGFSFYPTKNLGGCGDGGMITTDSDDMAERVRVLREHGQRRRYISDEVGCNSRLDALQAALLRVKLPHVEEWNRQRRRHAEHYCRALAELPLTMPVERPQAYHIYHQFTLRTTERDAICQALTAAEIGWAIYYPICLHHQPAFAGLGYTEGSLPVAEQASREVLSLPIYPELREDEVSQVCDCIRGALRA